LQIYVISPLKDRTPRLYSILESITGIRIDDLVQSHFIDLLKDDRSREGFRLKIALSLSLC